MYSFRVDTADVLIEQFHGSPETGSSNILCFPSLPLVSLGIFNKPENTFILANSGDGQIKGQYEVEIAILIL